MRIQALKFKARPATSEPERTFIHCRSTINEIREAHKDSPAAFLIYDNDLQVIREFKEIFISRGRKNKHKGLSQSLLGKNDDKIPFIQGNYHNTNQLTRSIRTLLKNTLKRGEENLYVIAVRKSIFEDMLSRTLLAGTQRQGKTRKDVYERDEDKLTFDMLSMLKGRYEEPESLEDEFIGKSIESQLIRQKITLACHADNTVLITGDTGTGKEVIAQAVHKYSKRSSHEIVAVNCGAIPPELFEAELFGYKKGAFTGALTDKDGLWKQADKGTLFLDEIADLRTDHQVKVLRAIDNGEIRMIGDIKTIKVDARIIAATNKDLMSAVQCGDFREDLFYRLERSRIRTSPIRQHPEDIPLLTQYFWKSITGDKNSSLPKDVIREIAGYSWPGNARELKSFLDKLYSYKEPDKIRAEHVRLIFHREGKTVDPKAFRRTKEQKEAMRVESIRHLRKVYEIIHAIHTVISTTIMKPHIAKSLLESSRISFSMRLNELEILSHQSLLFKSEKTFFDVFHFIGKLMYFHDLLDHDIQKARHYWNKEVNKGFKPAFSAIQKDISGVSYSS